MPTPISVITLSPSRVESSAGQEVKSRFRTFVDYSDSIKLNFKNAMALYGRGIDKMRLGRTEEGQADLTEALLQEPRIADEFALRGIVP